MRRAHLRGGVLVQCPTYTVVHGDSRYVCACISSFFPGLPCAGWHNIRTNSDLGENQLLRARPPCYPERRRPGGTVLVAKGQNYLQTALRRWLLCRWRVGRQPCTCLACAVQEKVPHSVGASDTLCRKCAQ